MSDYINDFGFGLPEASETDSTFGFGVPTQQHHQEPQQQLEAALLLPDFTDDTVATRYLEEHGTDLRWVHEWQTWVAWDESRWRRDVASAHATRRFKQTAMQVEMDEGAQVEAARTKAAADPEDASAAAWLRAATARLQRAVNLRNQSKVRAVLSDAVTHEGVLSEVSEWDARPWLLGVGNGVLDLKTGELRDARREDQVTEHLETEYHPDAQCPTWKQFLAEVTCGDKELETFLWKAVGYTLTGLTVEQCFFFLYGFGANGKSTFVDVLEKLLGSLAWSAPETLLASSRDGMAPSDVAALVGKRMVIATETDDGKAMAEANLKRLISGEKLLGAQKYGHPFTFTPAFSLWVTGNHRPTIKGTDDGIWRRTHLVPFNASFKDRMDRTLPDKLAAELEGILVWAVQGCLLWQKEGLTAPEVVVAATKDYREDMDFLGRFLEDEMEPLDGKTSTSAVYTRFREWCQENGHTYPMTGTAFTKRMKERGHHVVRSNGSWFVGIGTKSPGTRMETRIDNSRNPF